VRPVTQPLVVLSFLQELNTPVNKIKPAANARVTEIFFISSNKYTIKNKMKTLKEPEKRLDLSLEITGCFYHLHKG
jgi:hypothetical protein